MKMQIFLTRNKNINPEFSRTGRKPCLRPCVKYIKQALGQAGSNMAESVICFKSVCYWQASRKRKLWFIMLSYTKRVKLVRALC